MTTNGQTRNDQPNVVSSFSGLAHDVIELGELQAQLFALDVKHTTQNTRTSLVLVVFGVCMLLGSVPVALFALAELLHEQLEWSAAASFGVATLIGLILSAVILTAAWLSFSAGLVTMRRSRDELSRNIAWVKSSLRSRSQPNPTQNT
jgi:hypothetical protein